MESHHFSTQDERPSHELMAKKVLLDARHSVRSLLCTATYATPHERMFSYQRKSTSGVSIPSWLTTPGPVLLKRHVRNSKYDPLVDEVNLLEANPQYAHVQFPDGREDTISIKHLAPLGNKEVPVESDNQSSPVDTPPSINTILEAHILEHRVTREHLLSLLVFLVLCNQALNPPFLVAR